MWYLKIRYKHKDCIFTDKAHSLGVSFFHYYLGSYVKGNFVYTTLCQKLSGEKKNIKKYVTYLKKHKAIVQLEVYEETIFVLAKHKTSGQTHTELYNPMFLYPHPAVVDKEGFEVVHIAFWEKKPLQELVKKIKQGPTVEYFEILAFVKKDIEDTYVTRLLPKLPEKQKIALKLAYEQGYYTFPKKCDLGILSKAMGVSKETFREHLRKAESKLIPEMIGK